MPVTTAKIRISDLAKEYVNGESGERHLAVVTGADAATPGPQGIVWVPRDQWINGWRV